MYYTVSMKIDARVSVDVEADSFAEAFEKARQSCFDPEAQEVVDLVPVNASDAHGNMVDYNG